MKSDSIYFQLIIKELDTIQDIIRNLDDIIYKSKNFAFLTWGGSLYLVTQHLNIGSDEQKGIDLFIHLARVDIGLLKNSC